MFGKKKKEEVVVSEPQEVLTAEGAAENVKLRDELTAVNTILLELRKELDAAKEQLSKYVEPKEVLIPEPKEEVLIPIEEKPIEDDMKPLTEELGVPKPIMTDELRTELLALKDEMLRQNGELLQERRELQNKLDEKQERLEQILQASQEDRYRKDKVKLINKYIFQMNLIRKTLYDFNDHKEADREKSDDVLFLERQLNEVIVSMDSTLQQEMVERMVSATCCSEMKSDVQEVIGYEATNDPSKDGLVYKSVNPGYYWKLPYILKAKINDDGSEIKTYNFLIRPEQVIVYKLINN